MDFKEKQEKHVVFIAIALLFSLLLFGCVSQNAAPTVLPSLSPSPSSEPSLVSVVFTINNGTANYSKNLSVAKGTSVLAALEANFAVTKKEYSFGALVTGIDGLEQSDSSNKYWQYYVDGVLASVGAGDFKIEKSVSVEWRYEKPPEFK